MNSITLNPGQFAIIPSISGADGSGTVRTVHGSVQVSDYAKAYVCAYPQAGANAFAVVPKGVETPSGTLLAPGESQSITVTVNGTAVGGAALPPVVYPVTIQGPPPPPPADHLVVGESVAQGFDGQTWQHISDPGSDTVTF